MPSTISQSLLVSSTIHPALLFRSCSPKKRSSRTHSATVHVRLVGNDVHCPDWQRRHALTALLLQTSTAELLFRSLPALAVEGSERKGMGRYVKKKKLDPLDTYVPAVIAAKNQLQRAGGIMKNNLQGARELLRNGAFDGLRDNIRAIGEYAERGGSKDARKLSDKFFQSVEGFDFTLFQAKRNEQPVGGESEAALKTAVSSIDSLLATVPKNILDESAKIVEAVEGSFQAQPAVPKEGSDKQLDQLMQLVPTQAN